MTCRLRSDLYVAICQRRAIFLDLRRNRYFALPGRTDRAFQRLCADSHGPEDRRALQPLFAAGVLVDAPALPKLIVPDGPAKPHREQSPAPCSAGLLLGALIAQMRTHVLLHRRTLIQQQVTWAALRLDAAFDDVESHAVTLATLADAFRQTGLVFQPLDRCLPRSLAFGRMALARGVPVSLVFGIRANPFAAHCWVQWNGMVVNDTLERVEQFTPIAVL